MISRVAEEETVIDIALGDRGVAPDDNEVKPAKFSCLVVLLKFTSFSTPYSTPVCTLVLSETEVVYSEKGETHGCPF